jgi:hypothetical protein
MLVDDLTVVSLKNVARALCTVVRASLHAHQHASALEAGRQVVKHRVGLT